MWLKKCHHDFWILLEQKIDYFCVQSKADRGSDSMWQFQFISASLDMRKTTLSVENNFSDILRITILENKLQAEYPKLTLWLKLNADLSHSSCSFPIKLCCLCFSIATFAILCAASEMSSSWWNIFTTFEIGSLFAATQSLLHLSIDSTTTILWKEEWTVLCCAKRIFNSS